VLIAIQAASLNFPDLLIVQNKYQMKPPLPFVPGSEYAGVVEAVGEGVTHLKVGQAWPACRAPAALAPTRWPRRAVHAAAAGLSATWMRPPSS
jgi:NADPH:quinone reductase-like Zn-dependent oxidoreductase